MGEKRKREDETKEERRIRREQKKIERKEKEKKELKKKSKEEKEEKKRRKEEKRAKRLKKELKKKAKEEEKKENEMNKKNEKHAINVDGLDDSQQSKFLRLMGAKKNNIAAAKTDTNDKQNNDRSKALEKQFSQGISMKHGGNKHAGLGAKR